MIKRNKKLISLIVLTNFSVLNIINTPVIVSAKEIRSYSSYSNITKENDSNAIEYFKQIYKSKNKYTSDEVINIQNNKIGGLKHISLEVSSSDIQSPDGLTNVDSYVYLNDLVNTIKDNNAISKSFYTLTRNQSLTTNDNTQNRNDQSDTGSKLDFYFYPNAGLQNTDINNILLDAKNSLNDRYNVFIPNENFKTQDCNISDLNPSNLPKDIINLLGKGEDNALYNINSLIPGNESIPSLLGIKAYPLISTSKLELNENVECIELQVGDNHYLLDETLLNQDLLMNDLNIDENSTLTLNIFTKDNENSIHTYSTNITTKKSIKENDYKFNINSYSNSIDENGINYSLSVTCPDENKEDNVYSIFNFDNNTSKEVITIGNSNLESSGSADSTLTSMDMYYMDLNGYYYSKTFNNFIDLSNKSYNYQEEITLNFTGLTPSNSYKLLSINDYNLETQLDITNNKVTIESFNEKYLLKNGVNTVTITDGSTTYILSFLYNCNELHYKILGNNPLDNDTFKLNKNSTDIEIQLATNFELPNSNENFIYFGSREYQNCISTTITSSNLLKIKLTNLSDLPEDFQDTLNIKIGDKNIQFNVIRDAVMPNFQLLNHDSAKKVENTYYFDSDKIEFSIEDNKGIDKVFITEKNGEPEELTPNSTINRNSNYEFNNNILTFRNLDPNVIENYTIDIIDIYGNRYTEVLNLFRDTNTPSINLFVNNNSDIKIDDTSSNILYIQSNKVTDGKLDLSFSISEGGNSDLSLIDTTSIRLIYNNESYSFRSEEISYNELTKLYNVSLDLPDPYNVYSTHLFIKASDYAGHECSSERFIVKYYNDYIDDEDINFNLSSTLSQNNKNISSKFDMVNGNSKFYITNKLKNNKLNVNFDPEQLTSINSISDINIEYNLDNDDPSDDIQTTITNSSNKKDFDLKLTEGVNNLKFTINCYNGNVYKGNVEIYYDTTLPSIELIDSCGNNVLGNTNLKNPITMIRLKDSACVEVKDLVLTFNGTTLQYDDFYIDPNNNDYRLYNIENFTEGNYTLSYSIPSSIRNDTNNPFNDKNRDVISDNQLYIYDVTNPTLNSSVLKYNYKDTKVYSSTDFISVGKLGDATTDIVTNDNLSEKYDLYYEIKDLSGNIVALNYINNIEEYEIPLNYVDRNSVIKEKLPNGHYSISVGIKDNSNNSSSNDQTESNPNNYLTRKFIIDNNSPNITFSYDNFPENNNINKDFNTTVNVEDYDLNYVKIKVYKYSSIFDKNPIEIYSRTYDDDSTKEGANFSKRIDSSISELSNLDSGIYKIKVEANDRTNTEIIKNNESQFIIYDKESPIITLNKYEGNYSNCLIFNNNNGIITIGETPNGTTAAPDNHITVSDNLTSSCKIEYTVYKISYDEQNNIIKEESLNGIYNNGVDLSSLNDGRYQIELTVYDNANNSSNCSGNFIIDTNAPTYTINGLSNVENINHSVNLSVDINDFDISEVSVILQSPNTNPIEINSSVVEDIKFTANFGELNINGDYTLTINAKDRAGHTMETVTRNFRIDTEDPSINYKDFTTSYLNCKVYKNNNTTIKVGTSSDSDIEISDNLTDDCVLKYTIYSDNGTMLIPSTIIDNNYINLNTLANGRYRLEITATDNAGNESSAQYGYFIIDNQSPVVNINGLSNNNESKELFNNPFDLSVSISDLDINNAKVTLKTPNGDLIVKETGTITDKIFVADFGNLKTNGDYILTITASDRAGNDPINITRRFRIDTTAPIIHNVQVNDKNINTSSMNYTTSHNSPIFVNFSDNLDEVNVMNLSITATKNGITTSLSNGGSLKEDGEYIISIYASDLAGNRSSLYSFNLTVDTVFPTISTTGVNNGYYYNKNITPTWKVDDETASLNVTLNGNPFTSSEISTEGSYTLNISATDLAGNISTETINFVIDKTAPIISIENIKNLGYYTDPITPIIKWDDTDAIATILLQNINYFGQEINQDGSYVLYVKVVDKAGNISDLSYKFRLNISKPEIFVSGVNDGDTIKGSFTPEFKFKDTVEYNILLNGKEYHGEEITKEGNYSLVITAKDEDGIETVETINFKVESSPEANTSNDKNNDSTSSSPLPLAIGSIFGLILIAALCYYIYKKTKKDE